MLRRAINTCIRMYIKACDKSLKKQYNHKVIEQIFLVGDLVLYENQKNVNALPSEKRKAYP